MPKYDPLNCSAIFALASVRQLGSMSSGAIVIHNTRNGIKKPVRYSRDSNDKTHLGYFVLTA